jgi:hypothetical protein
MRAVAQEMSECCGRACLGVHAYVGAVCKSAACSRGLCASGLSGVASASVHGQPTRQGCGGRINRMQGRCPPYPVTLLLAVALSAVK